MIAIKRASAVAAACFLLSACQAIPVLDRVGQVRDATVAYNAAKTVGDFTELPAAFTGVRAIRGDSRIGPQKNEERVRAAFMANFDHVLRTAVSVSGAPIQVCAGQSQCSGAMTVQFIEDDYHQNLLERLSLGNKLRGRLLLVESGTGRIVHEQRYEVLKDYADVQQLVGVSLMQMMNKSFPPISEDKGRAIAARAQQAQWIAPAHAKVLKGAR